MFRPTLTRWAAILFLPLLCSCSSGPSSPALEGGVLATFVVSGETFKAFVTNDEAIETLFAVEAGTSLATIPNGALRSGAGGASHNEPWSWHMDPEDFEMAEATIELCDGTPSLVEADLEAWMVVGRFCPWGAELVSLQELR